MNPGSTIAEVMTGMPVTTGTSRPISVVRELMERYKVRHLPVVELGRLVGIVSERDIDRWSANPEVNPDAVPVSRVMSRQVLMVAPEDKVAEVAASMSARKVGSAVVVRRGDIVGIFTTTDALQALEGVSG
jgi:acetoin utilization protein AcuB